MSDPTHIMLYKWPVPASGDLSTRLEALDFVALRVASPEEAKSAFEKREGLISSVIISSDSPETEIKNAVRELRKLEPSSGLSFILAGSQPDESVRKKLRRVGIRIALWEPFDDGTLRFQINRAINRDLSEESRKDDRVPTVLSAQAKVGDRSKDVVVYSLSISGAFLKTQRASMDGAQIELDLHLPASKITLPARVIFANVPGNLQRPNLPMGMGVHFEEPSRESSRALAEYVQLRRSHLLV